MIEIKCDWCKAEYFVDNNCVIKICYCGHTIEVKPEIEDGAKKGSSR